MTGSDLDMKQQLMLSENFKITIINMLKDPVEKWELFMNKCGNSS